MRAIVALVIVAACAPDQTPLGGRLSEVPAIGFFQQTISRDGSVVASDGNRITLFTLEPGGWSVDCSQPPGCEQQLVSGRDRAVYGDTLGDVAELVRRDPSSGAVQWRRSAATAGAGKIVPGLETDDVWWFTTSYQGPTISSYWARYDAAGTRLAGGRLGFPLDLFLVRARPDGTFLGRETGTGALVTFDRSGGVRSRLKRDVFDAVAHEDGEITVVQTLHPGNAFATSLVRLDARGEQRWERSLSSFNGLVALPDGSVILAGTSGLAGVQRPDRSYFEHFDRDGNREVEFLDAPLGLVRGATFDGYAFYTYGDGTIDLNTHELGAGAWLVWRTPP